jgi:hypothetical protein
MSRARLSNQRMGDYTAHCRTGTSGQDLINEDMGPFYSGSHAARTSRIPQMPIRLRIFWDRLQTDLGAVGAFRKGSPAGFQTLRAWPGLQTRRLPFDKRRPTTCRAPTT